jgi:peroxiredoxin-like protein
MQPLPHHYHVTVTATEEGPAEITSDRLCTFASAPPREFDGPGDLWSPETLMVAAVADCFVLTFRAIAKVARLSWISFVCDAQGMVERSDGVIRFTAVRLRARLSISAAADAGKARKVLEKAEQACLVGNSLKCVPTLETELFFEEPVLAPGA